MRAVHDRAATRRGWALAVLLLAVGVGARADAPEVRTWKDPSGRFQIQAKYLGMNGANVQLEKPDGSRMQIDLQKLCSADRQYVEALKKKEDEENPFKAVDAAPAAAPGAAARPRAMAPASLPPGSASLPFDRAATPGAAAPVIRPDWSAATFAELPADGAWSLKVGPAPAATDAPADARPRALPVPPKADFFEKVTGFVINAPASHALIGFGKEHPKPATGRVILGDLRTGKLLGQYRAEGAATPMALSDAGDRALMRLDDSGPGNSSRLELWELGSEGLRKSWSLAPHADMDGGDRDVKWARFLGADRFATLGGKGKLVIWDLDSAQPRTTLAVDENCTPGLSPDGRLLAFVHEGNLGVADVAAGRVEALQTMPAGRVPWPGLAFSPSGKKLACVGGSKLWVWNVEDGSPLPEILLAPIAVGPGSSPIWTDEDHVLIGDRHLVDVASQVRTWRYEGAEAAVGDRFGVCWFLLRMTPRQPGAVVPAKLPQPAAVEALKRALADPNYFVLRPGATVSVNADGLPDASQRAATIAALTARLEAIQAKVANGSPLVLSATVTPGKEQDVSYRSFGQGLRTDNFKVRPQISGVKLTYQGKTAWEASASTLPMMDFARLGPNETLADHVKKFEKPNYGYFEQVEIPRLVARPGPGGESDSALGHSQITAAGVR